MPMERGWERDKVPEQQMDNEYSYVSLFIVATAYGDEATSEP